MIDAVEIIEVILFLENTMIYVYRKGVDKCPLPTHAWEVKWKIVVVATTTLQNFALACFGTYLPSIVVACLASSSPQASVSFLLKGILSVTVWFFPFTGCSPRLGPAADWVASQWNLCISRGKLAIPSRNYVISYDSLLGSRIAQSCQLTLPVGFT